MTDRPIIFSEPMVRALLDGRKTMTRRIMKLPTKARGGLPIYEHPKMGGWEPTTIGGGGVFTIGKNGERVPAPEEVAIWHRTCGDVIVPRYQPGDRLWVRENFSGPYDLTGVQPKEWPVGTPIWYWADNNPDEGDWTRPKPSIHLPQKFSRLTLNVTAVKIERLQEITNADAELEGVRCDMSPRSFRDHFEALWLRLHGEEAWDANPYVVAISFSVIKQNIDAQEGRGRE